MKKIIVVAILAIMAVSCASEATKSVKKLDSFVEKLEAKYENYTQEDWRNANEEYKALWTAVNENWDQMTQEEQQKCSENEGKYIGLFVKSMSSNVGKAIDGAVDGFVKALGGEEK